MTIGVKSKDVKGVPNKHLHSRISYLHQAAQYLARQSDATESLSNNKQQTANSTNLIEQGRAGATLGATKSVDIKRRDDSASERRPLVSGQALRLSSHLLAVSQRSKVAVSRDIKRSICKCCNELLIPGKTAAHSVENKSKGGRKPWADVLVVVCRRCGFQKRYPVGQQRQPKKKDRAEAEY